MAETDLYSSPLDAAIHTRWQVRVHLMVMVGIALGLSLLIIPLRGIDHQGNADFHAAVEVLGAVVGLTAGVAMAAQFLAMGNRFHLMVGLALFLNGVADLIHGTLDYAAYHAWFTIDTATLRQIITTTGTAGRVLAAGTLDLAFCLPAVRIPVEERKARMLRMGIGGLLVAIVLTMAGVYLPRDVYRHSSWLIARPIDFVCALGFLGALGGLLHRYFKAREMISWWIAMSITIQLIGQVAISFSTSFYDTLYELSHVYRFFSYIFPMLGFLLYQIARIADYHRTGEELKRSREAADAANRAKSAFLANMSHEIRTPMTAIVGFSELLSDPSLSPGERLECIETVRRNGKHLLTLINDILDLSRIEAGRMEIERIDCDLHTLISDAVSPLRCCAHGKGLALEVEYQPGVPARINTDPTRLAQVLMNLVGNAVKFTHVGGVRVVVRPAAATGPRRPGTPVTLAIDVTDSGIGLSPEQIAMLFRPFVQADASTTRRFGGSGLGLAISQRFAQMLGGAITVTSTPQQGSTFTLTIDAGVNATANQLTPFANATTASVSGTGASSYPLKGCRLLLAEDSPDNQRLICFHLQRAGATVAVAENGQIAADKVLAAGGSEGGFNLILMDMQMPVLDGYQAAARLRQAGCLVPIVAITAHAMESDRARCLAVGCSDYISKPIDKDRLISVIRRQLREQAGLVRHAGSNIGIA